jgi:hypothetical protein
LRHFDDYRGHKIIHRLVFNFCAKDEIRSHVLVSKDVETERCVPATDYTVTNFIHIRD